MCRSTKPKKCITVNMAGKYFDNLHCNEVGRDPQAKLAKPNWRRSDPIAGAQVGTSVPSSPARHAASGLGVRPRGGRDCCCEHCSQVRLGFSQGGLMALLHLLHGSQNALQKQEQNILPCTNSVCLVCLRNFTFLARCIWNRVIAAAYVSKEQETDCQRPSQDISKISKHNMHIRWSECQHWDKLNLQRKCCRNFPLNHTKL